MTTKNIYNFLHSQKKVNSLFSSCKTRNILNLILSGFFFLNIHFLNFFYLKINKLKINKIKKKIYLFKINFHTKKKRKNEEQKRCHGVCKIVNIISLSLSQFFALRCSFFFFLFSSGFFFLCCIFEAN